MPTLSTVRCSITRGQSDHKIVLESATVSKSMLSHCSLPASSPPASTPDSPHSVSDELSFLKDSGWNVLKKDWRSLVRAARYATAVADQAANEAATAVLASEEAAHAVNEAAQRVATSAPSEAASALKRLKAARVLASEMALVERQATARFRQVVMHARAAADEMKRFGSERATGSTKMLAIVDAAIVEAKAKKQG